MRLLFAILIGLSIGVIIDHVTDAMVDCQFPEPSYTPAQVKSMDALVMKAAYGRRLTHPMTQAEQSEAIVYLYGEQK